MLAMFIWLIPVSKRDLRFLSGLSYRFHLRISFIDDHELCVVVIQTDSGTYMDDKYFLLVIYRYSLTVVNDRHIPVTWQYELAIDLWIEYCYFRC